MFKQGHDCPIQFVVEVSELRVAGRADSGVNGE